MGLFDGTPLERPVTCEHCGAELSDCQCPPPSVADTAPERQRLKIRVEKRKRGKIATVVTGFSCTKGQVQAVLTGLKNKCGSGGTIAQGSPDKKSPSAEAPTWELELQGDHSDRTRQFLAEAGYRV